MSEESLLDGVAADTSETQQEAATAQINEDIEKDTGPALERPEWLQDRYLQGGRGLEEAIKEQAKGYNELRSKLGGFTGAPEAYELGLPEGIEGEVDSELPAYKEFLDVAKEANMSNETAQKLFNIFVGYQQSIINEIGADAQQQKQLLGEKADQRIASLSGWGMNNLSKDDMEVYSSMLTTAAQVQLMEKIVGKTRGTQMHKTGETSSIPAFTEDDFRRAVQSERYYSDPAYRAEVQKKAQAILPG
jgi:hypothetical protein